MNEDETKKFMIGEYRSSILNCVNSKLEAISNKYKDLLEKEGINFGRTFVVYSNDTSISIVDDPNFPKEKVPQEVLSKVDLVIASCLEKYNVNAS